MVISHTFTFSVISLFLTSLFVFPVCFLPLSLMSEAGVSCSVIACSALMCHLCLIVCPPSVKISTCLSSPHCQFIACVCPVAFCPVFSVDLAWLVFVDLGFVLNFGIFFHHHPSKLHMSLLSFSTTLHTTCCPCGVLACLQSIPVSERFLHWPWLLLLGEDLWSLAKFSHKNGTIGFCKWLWCFVYHGPPWWKLYVCVWV